MPGCLAALDRPCELNGAPEQEQFFRERGFTGVGMGDDRKGATPLEFRVKV
jgi:hypothetical protein